MINSKVNILSAPDFCSEIVCKETEEMGGFWAESLGGPELARLEL
jgi:hypothetical protein